MTVEMVMVENGFYTAVRRIPPTPFGGLCTVCFRYFCGWTSLYFIAAHLVIAFVVVVAIVVVGGRAKARR